MSEASGDLPTLEFWNVERTAEELGIVASSLKNVRPYLHVLRLPRNTSLYPNIYTTLFKEVIHDNGSRDLAEPARALARSPEALPTVELEEDILDFTLYENIVDGFLYASDIRKFLGVSPATITDWNKRGDMSMERRGAKTLVIPATEVVNAISWQRPEGMPPAGPLITEPLAPRY